MNARNALQGDTKLRRGRAPVYRASEESGAMRKASRATSAKVVQKENSQKLLHRRAPPIATIVLLERSVQSQGLVQTAIAPNVAKARSLEPELTSANPADTTSNQMTTARPA